MYWPLSDSIEGHHCLCDRASAEEAIQPGEKLAVDHRGSDEALTSTRCGPRTIAGDGR